jgi:hypothetical protein
VSLDRIKFRSFEWWLDDDWREAIHEGGVYKLQLVVRVEGIEEAKAGPKCVSSILGVRNV